MKNDSDCLNRFCVCVCTTCVVHIKCIYLKSRKLSSAIENDTHTHTHTHILWYISICMSILKSNETCILKTLKRCAGNKIERKMVVWNRLSQFLSKNVWK